MDATEDERYWIVRRAVADQLWMSFGLLAFFVLFVFVLLPHGLFAIRTSLSGGVTSPGDVVSLGLGVFLTAGPLVVLGWLAD